MRHRIGITDVAAAALVLVALVLPPRESKVESAYASTASSDEGPPLAELRAKVSAAEGRVAADPGDAAAAEELAHLLEEVGQHDQALRVAGEAVAHGGPEVWRALRALSSTHAARLEFAEAHDQVQKALRACEEAGATCAEQEKIRLRLFAEELEAAVRAVAAGIDPRRDPDAFRAKVQEIHPTVRFRLGKPR
jgi:hypothetical protein